MITVTMYVLLSRITFARHDTVEQLDQSNHAHRSNEFFYLQTVLRNTIRHMKIIRTNLKPKHGQLHLPRSF